ncbi:MAG: hypothetical protein ACP6IQ_06885 [Candidatus Njordarchaeia archaeon]|nr:hypothetical protein [Candidatus Korarchaeota archaeon]
MFSITISLILGVLCCITIMMHYLRRKKISQITDTEELKKAKYLEKPWLAGGYLFGNLALCILILNNLFGGIPIDLGRFVEGIIYDDSTLYIDSFMALLIISLTSILIWKFARKSIYYGLLETESSVCALIGIIFGIGIVVGLKLMFITSFWFLLGFSWIFSFVLGLSFVISLISGFWLIIGTSLGINFIVGFLFGFSLGIGIALWHWNLRLLQDFGYEFLVYLGILMGVCFGLWLDFGSIFLLGVLLWYIIGISWFTYDRFLIFHFVINALVKSDSVKLSEIEGLSVNAFSKESISAIKALINPLAKSFKIIKEKTSGDNLIELKISLPETVQYWIRKIDKSVDKLSKIKKKLSLDDLRKDTKLTPYQILVAMGRSQEEDTKKLANKISLRLGHLLQ